jgi:hypothetical protein
MTHLQNDQTPPITKWYPIEFTFWFHFQQGIKQEFEAQTKRPEDMVIFKITLLYVCGPVAILFGGLRNIKQQ